MPEFLEYGFMLRALAVGVLAAVVLPLLGSFLVARRYALISDSLAHVSLAGVGLGLLLGQAPILVALPVAMIGALLLEWLRQARRISGEVGLAILMSGGLALAIVLATMARGTGTDFTAYLFGSIATTSITDVVTMSIVGAVACIFVIANYRALLHIAFDEDGARIAGRRVTLLNYALVALTAAVVVLSLRIVGGLLISALLVMPVVTAGWFAKRFITTMYLAILCALVAVVAGLATAFYIGIAAGGAIVLSALVLLLLTIVWKK